jgi:hypothetical protein
MRRSGFCGGAVGGGAVVGGTVGGGGGVVVVGAAVVLVVLAVVEVLVVVVLVEVDVSSGRGLLSAADSTWVCWGLPPVARPMMAPERRSRAAATASAGQVRYHGLAGRTVNDGGA